MAQLPGTVWLKPATLATVVRDIVSSLREQGIHKVVIINEHGGNFVLEPVIRELNQRFADTDVILPDEGIPMTDHDSPLFEAADQEVHAGEIETSTQLYLNSTHVRAELQDYVPFVGREFLDYVTLDLISPTGVWGNASYGNAAKGEHAIAGEVQAIVEFVRQAFEILSKC